MEPRRPIRQCHVCHRYSVMRVVEHPSGTVLLCAFCSAPRVVAWPLAHASGS